MSAPWTVPALAHIEGPLGTASWIALVASALFVAWTIFRSVKYTVRPGEEEPTHIKRLVLHEPMHIEVAASSGPGPEEQQP